MNKFVVMLTKGNDEKILAVCDTKEEAITKGDELIKELTMDSGLLNLISTEFDENNNPVNLNKYKFYRAW